MGCLVFDRGGAAVTIYQLIKSQKFIKEEFITGRYEKIIMGNQYDLKSKKAISIEK